MLIRKTLKHEIIDKDFTYRGSDSVNFTLYVFFSYEVRHIIARMENILKNSVIFWEDLIQKPNETIYLFDLAYRLSDRFIKVYDRSIAVSNTFVEKMFMNIFYNFLRVTGYRYKHFRSHFHDLLKSKDFQASQMLRLNSTLIQIQNDFLMLLLSAEKESAGKILFASYSSEKLLNIEPSNLLNDFIESILVPGKLIRNPICNKRCD